MPREYTMEEKADALAIYVEHGVAEAWRRTGIPKPTIASWAQRSGLHTNAISNTRAASEMHKVRQAELRERLRGMLLEKAVDILDRMDAPHVEFKGKDADAVEYPIAPASAVQNYATSAAILIDKYRLEVGEATGRTESFTNDFADHEAREIADAIREELAGRARRRTAPHPDRVAVERTGSD